ncbi:MAG: class I adenylate-forming enzyme family protein, partial [Sciscionella sp.]
MLAWRWREEDVLVHALPLSHQHGLSGVHATLLAGSAAVILSQFTADDLLEQAAKHRATVLFAVPSVYQRLIAEPAGADRLAALDLRLAISGSAPLSAALSTTLAATLGEPPLERYGSTESGLNVSNPFDGPRKPGAVGLALPGVQLRVADESGAERDAGHEGEILVRGPQVFGGYWNQPQASAAAFHPGGWFRTGDLGRIDPHDGYLTITGRIKELIISGGLNVYPREVEQVLQLHLTVSEAAVAGLPSDRWGEEVTAWVVPATGAEVDTAELLAHCRELLSAYKCPKRIYLADELPRTSMGKLKRGALVRAAAEWPIDRTMLDHAVAALWRVEL